MSKLNLLDRLAISRVIAMVLDFIVTIVKIFKEPNKIEEKRKPWWRKK